MKNSDLILIAMAAGVLLFVVAKTGKGPIGAMTPGPGASGAVPANTGAVSPTSEIMAPSGGDWSGPGQGWQYFTDGTAISPQGVYYYQGREVYNPAGMFGG